MYAFEIWLDGHWVPTGVGLSLQMITLLQKINFALHEGRVSGRRSVKADDGRWVPIDATE